MRLAILPLGLCSVALSYGQGINAYAQITAVSGTVLTVGTASESVTSFAAGKDIVIMQMQDDVIGANTGNNANFGDLGSIQQAGRYSIRRIASVTRSGATLTAITLTSAPGVTFNVGSNSAVQAITFEVLGGGGNYTLGSALSPPAWNGSIGGVLAFQVGGVLTLAANITADAVGFRGGARDRFNYTTPCNTVDYFWSGTAAGTEYFAAKGEGIYKNTNVGIADGRGKMLNGGGGANQINAGGGGGSNYTAGGSAVLGWSCAADAGGIGGIALNGSISANRVFMGGGGGGGEGNDDVSTDGANGGGIILIKANQLKTTGTCAGLRISADGGSASHSGNDGAGGGGGGGSIVFQVPSYSLTSTCPLTIRANGGNGGTVNNGSTHGGGGGGGQGTVIFSTPAPTSNVTIQTQNGTGGCNQTPCANRAGSGAGSSNSGIVVSSIGALPIELLSFQAVPVRDRVDVRWSTATELDNDHFDVERSIDGDSWYTVLTLPGAGTSTNERTYAAMDMRPLPGRSFYRLKQTDTDGASTLSDAVMVELEADADVLGVVPNPANASVTLVRPGINTGTAVELFDAMGRTLHVPIERTNGSARLDIASLPEGCYVVSVTDQDRRISQRLVVEHH